MTFLYIILAACAAMLAFGLATFAFGLWLMGSSYYIYPAGLAVGFVIAAKYFLNTPEEDADA